MHCSLCGAPKVTSLTCPHRVPAVAHPLPGSHALQPLPAVVSARFEAAEAGNAAGVAAEVAGEGEEDEEIDSDEAGEDDEAKRRKHAHLAGCFAQLAAVVGRFTTTTAATTTTTTTTDVQQEEEGEKGVSSECEECEQ